MIPGFSLLALAGVATAWEHHQQIHHVRNQPIFEFKRDIEDRDTHPCKVLSQAYKAAGGKLGEAIVIDVKPSIGLACLKSVPLAKERDIALLEYLAPLVEFQSTLEVLANPPDEYLFSGVDVLGGLATINKTLLADGYDNQYDFMVALRAIFAASFDNHFDYPPAILNTIQFMRQEMDFVSLSSQGTHLPRIFMSLDVARANQGILDYRPSAVKSIDGIPVKKWLEQDAIYNVANFQDPDAQYNALFTSIQRANSGSSGSSIYSAWEIPDTYTIKFHNGSSYVAKNGLFFAATADFTNIESGEDFQNAFEIPSTKSKRDSQVKYRRADESDSSSALPGYPEPYVQHSMNTLAGYFLDGDYKDTAVLSVLSFLPVGVDAATLENLNFTDYMLEAQTKVAAFFKEAEKRGCEKLVVDLSANGGGYVLLASELYRLIFPDGKFSHYDRYRATELLKVASEADYDTLVNTVISGTQYYPIGVDGNSIDNGKEWYGPDVAGGQNVTAAYQDNLSVPYDDTVPLYINGENSKYSVITKAIFKPENILIVTDGTCASACNIFTGLMTHNHGVRTLALGGRHFKQPMQAMGGVKGSRLTYFGNLISSVASYVTSVENNKKAMQILNEGASSFPSFQDAPLLPLIQGSEGGRFNSLNAYTEDNLDGYPVHFRYEAANCRLFYTQAMTKDVTEQWRMAYDAAWNGAKCVPGSTANSDDTMSDETVKYNKQVRSNATPMPNAGSV